MNTSKILVSSHKLVTQRIEKIVRGIVNDAEDSGSSGALSFENLGVVLHRLGIFQSLEFNKDDNLNQSSLTINQTRAKPERLNSEV